jgi:hypothetical protein
MLASRRPGAVRWLRAIAASKSDAGTELDALCHAQAPLPTTAAPPVKLRFESSPARQFLPLSAAQACESERADEPWQARKWAERPRRAHQTPVHVHRGLAGAARALRRPRS